jgi:sugar phosphate isomerase/epimerase
MEFHGLRVRILNIVEGLHVTAHGCLHGANELKDIIRGNFLCVDEDPITAVSRVAPYAFHAHVKDFRYVKEGECCGSILTRGANRIVGTVTGEGVVPVKQCLAILKRAGYDGYVSVEYEGIEDCIAGLTRAVANVKSFIALI